MALNHWPQSGVITEEVALRFGRRMLVSNIVATALTAAALLISGLFGWKHWGWGVAAGMLYSNAFEYVYHRYLLHRPGGRMTAPHAEHHNSFGRAEEALHVTFSCSPTSIVLLLVIHSLPFAYLDRVWHAGIGAGLIIGFTVYFILFEGLHWQIHVGWLPRSLRFMRNHHYGHHRRGAGGYNVFLPLFDALFRT